MNLAIVKGPNRSLLRRNYQRMPAQRHLAAGERDKSSPLRLKEKEQCVESLCESEA